MRSTHTSYRWRGALTTHQLQVERRESHRANQVYALNTHQLQVEREREMVPIKWMGIIRRPWWIRASGGNLARIPGLHPILFTRSAMWFLITPESQDLGLMSNPKVSAFFYSIVSPSLHWGVRTQTQTAGWAPPAGLTNTSSSSYLDFPGCLPSRYWPGSTLLSFSGQPVLGRRVILMWTHL